MGKISVSSAISQCGSSRRGGKLPRKRGNEPWNGAQIFAVRLAKLPGEECLFPQNQAQVKDRDEDHGEQRARWAA